MDLASMGGEEDRDLASDPGGQKHELCDVYYAVHVYERHIPQSPHISYKYKL